MNAQTMAQKAYSQSAASTRTDRAIEYDMIAKITYRIKSAAEAGPTAYPQLVQALYDNRRLWTTLAVDVADRNNQLPSELRAQIFYLSEFIQVQTGKVLARKARLAPILEVNAAILRGLSGRRSER